MKSHRSPILYLRNNTLPFATQNSIVHIFLCTHLTCGTWNKPHATKKYEHWHSGISLSPNSCSTRPPRSPYSGQNVWIKNINFILHTKLHRICAGGWSGSSVASVPSDVGKGIIKFNVVGGTVSGGYKSTDATWCGIILCPALCLL